MLCRCSAAALLPTRETHVKRGPDLGWHLDALECKRQLFLASPALAQPADDPPRWKVRIFAARIGAQELVCTLAGNGDDAGCWVVGSECKTWALPTKTTTLHYRP